MRNGLGCWGSSMSFKPMCFPDFKRPQNEKWGRKLGFKHVIQQDWDTLVAQEGAEELLKTLVETPIQLLLGINTVSVDPKLVNMALGMLNKGDTKSYKP